LQTARTQPHRQIAAHLERADANAAVGVRWRAAEPNGVLLPELAVDFQTTVYCPHLRASRIEGCEVSLLIIASDRERVGGNIDRRARRLHRDADGFHRLGAQ